ncbi:hypothetical protein AB0D07_23180, partial [Streptomyces globisporus]
MSSDVDLVPGPEAGEAGTRAADPGDGTDVSRRRWPRVLGALLAVALIATGGVLYAEGRQLRDTPATANLALTDAEATTRVTGDVSSRGGDRMQDPSDSMETVEPEEGDRSGTGGSLT